MQNFQASLRRAGRGLVGVSMLGLVAPAFAEEAPASEDSDDGVIIVTAQKRAQNSLDVGINVSVFGSEAIAERRLESVSELAGTAPNVTVKENVPGLLPVVTIRGIGLNDFSATNNPSAGVYVDEVPLSSLALMNFNFFDVDRLEVLKVWISVGVDPPRSRPIILNCRKKLVLTGVQIGAARDPSVHKYRHNNQCISFRESGVPLRR